MYGTLGWLSSSSPKQWGKVSHRPHESFYYQQSASMLFLFLILRPNISLCMYLLYDRTTSSWWLSLLEVSLPSSHLSGNTWEKGWRRVVLRELLWLTSEQQGEISSTAVTFSVMTYLAHEKKNLLVQAFASESTIDFPLVLVEAS